MRGGTFSRVALLAQNTFREAVRQRFFSFLIILAIGLVVSSLFFRQFDFGSSELKFIADLGVGAIFVFGSILSVVMTAQLFFSEIDNRTVLNLLAKPVARWEFILGKYLGVMLLISIFVVILVGLLAGMLYWRESVLLAEFPDSFSEGRVVQYSGIAWLAVFQLLRFGVLVGITLFISSFAQSNLYAVTVSFFIMLICQLQYLAKQHWQDISFLPFQYIALLTSFLVPNFQLFGAGEDLLFAGKAVLTLSDCWRVVGYGVGYIALFNFLAMWSFRNREI